MSESVGCASAEGRRRGLVTVVLLALLGAIAFVLGLAMIAGQGALSGAPFGVVLAGAGVWAMVTGVGS